MASYIRMLEMEMIKSLQSFYKNAIKFFIIILFDGKSVLPNKCELRVTKES